MKYIKLYEGYIINPSFIRLKNILEKFIVQIYPSYTVTLVEETKETWSTILIRDGNGNVFLSFVYESKYLEINSREDSEELSNYIASLMNINEHWIIQIEINRIDELIDKLNDLTGEDFEMWRDVKKYNL